MRHESLIVCGMLYSCWFNEKAHFHRFIKLLILKNQTYYTENFAEKTCFKHSSLRGIS